MNYDYLIGSIFEIKTARGWNYIQYAHPSEIGIPLVGVIQEERSSPASSALEIRGFSYRYFVFYQFAEAIKRGDIRFIGVEQIPEEWQEFPILRSPGPTDSNGKIPFWFIYNVPVTFNYKRLQNTDVRFKVSQLTEDQKQLSTTTIISHKTLIERLESGWLPKDEI